MRLTEAQAESIRRLTLEIVGPQARIRLFGSRLDNAARGGDVDLLLELPYPADNPALLCARQSARISRLLDGRQVDVVPRAPNLKRLPIHNTMLRSRRGDC